MSFIGLSKTDDPAGTENRTRFSFTEGRENEIHLWRIGMTVEKAALRLLEEQLSLDEKLRAAGFIQPRDRRAFTIRRAATREILNLYLHTSPSRLRVAYNLFGKPEIIEDNTIPAIKFNVTQARDAAFCAVVCGREVGIDAERVEQTKSNLEIADLFFADSEKRDLRRLSGEARTAAFYRCWTRKEAFVKATGEGLSHPLDSFRVSTGAEILSSVRFADETETRNWNLLTIAPDDATILSIACENAVSSLRFFEWIPDPPFYTPTAFCAFDLAACRFSGNSLALT